VELRGVLLAAAPRARAASTASQYAAPWRAVTKWAEDRNVSALPMDERVAALYLAKELRRCYQARPGPAAVLQASAAIHFHHWVCGFPSPTKSNFCGVAREVAKRTLRTERAAKETVATDTVDTVLRRLLASGTLPDLMVAMIIALGFYGFLRASEILAIEWQQIRVFAEYAEFFIADSKTDQYHEGRWVIVAAAPLAGEGAGALCPIALLKRLLWKGDYRLRDAGAIGGLLIRGVAASPKREQPHMLRGPTVGLSYSTILAKSRAAFQLANPEFRSEAFAMHALRISGATEAARAEVPDRLRLTQGGWKSEITLRRYTREGLPAQAAVSKAMMGLVDKPLPNFE
jgi:hypothetical protein